MTWIKLIILALLLVGCSNDKEEKFKGNITMPLGMHTILEYNMGCRYAGRVNDNTFSVASTGVEML